MPQIDTEAITMLSKLRDEVVPPLMKEKGQWKEYTIPWGPGVTTAHIEYLRQFAGVNLVLTLIR